jgi:hypothetical protein
VSVGEAAKKGGEGCEGSVANYHVTTYPVDTLPTVGGSADKLFDPAGPAVGNKGIPINERYVYSVTLFRRVSEARVSQDICCCSQCEVMPYLVDEMPALAACERHSHISHEGRYRNVVCSNVAKGIASVQLLMMETWPYGGKSRIQASYRLHPLIHPRAYLTLPTTCLLSR